MLTLLTNGVKGGKWFSLMDKVYALATLQAAWQQVQKNKGSHGVDGMSIERFAVKQEQYLLELKTALIKNRDKKAKKMIHLAVLLPTELLPRS